MHFQYHHLLIIAALIALFAIKPSEVEKKTIQLLRLLITLNLVFEIAATVKWYTYNSTNIVVYNFVTGYSFPIWMLLLNKVNNTSKRIYLFAVVFFLLLFISNLFFIQGLYTFNTLSFLAGTLMVTAFSLYTLLLESENKLRLSNFSILMIYAGLIYFIGFSAMFFTNEWKATEIELGIDFTLYQLVSYSINTLFYGMIIIACIKLRWSIKNNPET